MKKLRFKDQEMYVQEHTASKCSRFTTSQSDSKPRPFLPHYIAFVCPRSPHAQGLRLFHVYAQPTAGSSYMLVHGITIPKTKALNGMKKAISYRWKF